MSRNDASAYVPGQVYQGTVKWFKKSYGFIQVAGMPDVFVHFTAIEMDGFKTLSEGQEVAFEVQPSDRGFAAAHVRAAA